MKDSLAQNWWREGQNREQRWGAEGVPTQMTSEIRIRHAVWAERDSALYEEGLRRDELPQREAGEQCQANPLGEVADPFATNAAAFVVLNSICDALDLNAQFLPVIKSILGFLGEQAMDESDAGRGEVFAQGTERRGLGADDLGHDFHGTFAVERTGACEQVVHGGAEGVHVAAAVEVVGFCLFGAHVLRGADCHALLCGVCALCEALCEALGDAKVEQFHISCMGDHDVGGLDVAVENAFFAVGVVEAAGDFTSNAEDFSFAECATGLLEEFIERHAVDQGHAEVGEALVLAR